MKQKPVSLFLFLMIWWLILMSCGVDNRERTVEEQIRDERMHF